MVLKLKKRKSPRKKTNKGAQDQGWLLPASLVLALGGGIAALLWPNPKLREDQVAVEPATPPAPAVQKSSPRTATAAKSESPVTIRMPEPRGPEIQAPAEPQVVLSNKPEVAPRLAPATKGTPRVAIVLDDMGLDHAAARRAADLPEPVTLAFLPYATDLPTQTANAQRKGHELMVHMPMEPTLESTNPGPNALRVGLDSDEIKRRIEANLGQFSGYVGFNNHMGSRFTADTPGMRLVIAEARERGLWFLDSRTTQKTVGASLARSMGVPYAARDVFLDNNRDPAAIRKQLAELAALAQKHGSAIAIGHPYPETLAALEKWLPEARGAGYDIVPLSALVKSGKTVVATPAATLTGPASTLTGDGS